jgi:hypothetical protein
MDTNSSKAGAIAEKQRLKREEEQKLEKNNKPTPRSDSPGLRGQDKQQSHLQDERE